MAQINPLEALKSDHQEVRDNLLALLDALSKKDATRALEVLIYLDKLTGPHFRFEEESLYPALKKLFGEAYYEHLLTAHDRVIKAAKELAAVLGKGELTDEEAQRLVELVRREVLPHPVECEGLALFAERLSQEELDAIAESIEKARQEAVPLLEWAETIRERKIA